MARKSSLLWALGGFAFSLLAIIVLGGDGADLSLERQFVDTLRSQLEKCGPDSLGARPCPPRSRGSERSWSSSRSSFSAGTASLAVLGLYLYVRCRYSYTQAVARLDVRSCEAALDERGHRWTPPPGSTARLIHRESQTA